MRADCSLNAGHKCAPGGCGEHLALRWWSDRSAAYVAALEANSNLQGQFEQALVEKDLEKACCLLQSLVVHAVGEPGVKMTRTWSLCAHLKHSQGAALDPPWFSDECAPQSIQGLSIQVVRSGQAAHACKEARKHYRASVRRSKRAHSKHFEAAYSDKLHSKRADLHSMLRYPQRTHPFPLTEQAWLTYLDDHFVLQGEVQDSRPSPCDMAVLLGRGHPSPVQLLANGAATG